MILVHYVSLCRACVLEHGAKPVTNYTKLWRCDGCGYCLERAVCRLPVNQPRQSDPSSENSVLDPS